MNLILLPAYAITDALFQRVLPPAHPIFVNFTAALVPASLISDVLGRLLRRQSLMAAGWWMLCYAAIITPVTAFTGWWWLWQMDGTDMPEMSIHKWLGTSLVVVFVLLVVWRARIHRRNGTPSAAYLLVCTLAVAALVVQGDLGGRMSFGTNASSPAPEYQDNSNVEWRDHIDLKE